MPPPLFLQNLLKLHERQESVIADLRAKLKQLRRDGATRDKQLELAHRTVERLSISKNSVEAGEAANKAYIRQLETRIAGMNSASDLHTLCKSLQTEVKQLKQQVKESHSRAAAAEDEAWRHQQEAQLSRRGLELAAEQLSRSTASDISATMLMAVSQSHEEAVTLASQLAERQEQIDQMTQALAAARAHLHAQHDALEQWQSWEATQTQKAREVEEALREQCARTQALERKVEALKPAAKEAKRERDAARHHLELEKTARIEAEERVQALRAELQRRDATEVQLRAELRRLEASEQAARTRPAAGAAVGANTAAMQHARAGSRPESALHSHVQAVSGPSTSKAWPHQQEVGSLSLQQGTPLDVTIAELERDLAQLASALPPFNRPESELSSPERPFQQRIPVPAPPSFRSPCWRTNPLASPEKDAQPGEQQVGGSTDEHDAAQPKNASTVRQVAEEEAAEPEGSDDAAWGLLQARLDQQRGEERHLMARWQPGQPLEMSETRESSASEAPSYSHEHSGGPCVAESGAGRAPNLTVDVSEVPGALPSPGIASNRLVSPDLVGMTLESNGEWLNGSLGDGLERLVAAPAAGHKREGSSSAVTVQAFAGVAPSVTGGEQRPAEDHEQQKPVRYSLFELANMEMPF